MRNINRRLILTRTIHKLVTQCYISVKNADVPWQLDFTVIHYRIKTINLISIEASNQATRIHKCLPCSNKKAFDFFLFPQYPANNNIKWTYFIFIAQSWKLSGRLHYSTLQTYFVLSFTVVFITVVRTLLSEVNKRIKNEVIDVPVLSFVRFFCSPPPFLYTFYTDLC